MMNEKPAFWAILPATVRYDEALSSTAKLLYAEISALQEAKGYCFAKNRYFAEVFGCSERTIQRLVRELESRGFIRIQIVQGADGELVRMIWTDVRLEEKANCHDQSADWSRNDGEDGNPSCAARHLPLHKGGFEERIATAPAEPRNDSEEGNPSGAARHLPLHKGGFEERIATAPAEPRNDSEEGQPLRHAARDTSPYTGEALEGDKNVATELSGGDKNVAEGVTKMSPMNNTSNNITSNTPLNPPAEGRRAKTMPKHKPERFERFWEYYRTHARGENRQGAIKAWDRLKPTDELIDTMAAALARQIKREDWQKGMGIPYASTWLNNARWEDDTGPGRGDTPGEVDARGGLEAW